MNADTQSTEVGSESTEAAKAEKQLANIVRGTLPRALVYLIRFDSEKGAKEADIAKRFGTTSGKVADILKGRNFAYIDEAFVPTQEDKDAAVKWLKQVPDYDNVGTDEIVVSVGKLGTASDDDAKALADKRAAVRAKNAAEAPAKTGADGESPTAQGGNKGKGNKGGGNKGGKAEGATNAKATEDLMG